MRLSIVFAQGRQLGALLGRQSGPPVQALRALVGGPALSHQRGALEVVKRGVMDFAALLAKVDQHEGPFGDHLKRILVAVSQMPEVMDHRLLAASVVYQSGDNRIDFSSELYRRYLRMHLAR